MVQVTFDTAHDTLEELEASLRVLQSAIERRKGAPEPGKHKPTMEVPSAGPSDEETAVDTPFIKITVKSDDDAHRSDKRDVPTLNQLISDESLTEDELRKLYKEVLPVAEEEDTEETGKAKKTEEQPERKEKGQDEYIEIIEYTEEKE